MDKKSTSSSPVFYLLVILGLLCVMVLGMCLAGVGTLHEAMAESNSPMVGGAPFVIEFFIFVFSWLSYAFLSAAVSQKSRAEGRAPLYWRASAWWFAVAMTILSTLFFIFRGI